ncbi:FKBP-type peptidyl-prolyl cis-trans isomerase [Agromyces sp. LHK192]|uniref:FKBP-type peptidyl-prolyl cis-trans isomerase n=1 Tax=Agromyces sp. LHK192 TaxID=2498704 RepID=UPI0013E365E5|nr:FKBP-type peptidyl-prolyl cis-trans isomerase [Agromyces sp. LHK192]
MRSSLALVATAGLVAVALTGCATAPAPEAAPGNTSSAVQVSGDFGEPPRVEFPSPVNPEETQCSVVIEGDGRPVVAGSPLLVAATLFDPESGEEVQAVGYDEPVLLTVGDSTLAGFRKGLTCANEGSRVVVAVPPADALNPQTGAEPETGIVAVFDVLRVFPARAEGSATLTRDGFPAVVLAPDGRPGITVPTQDPFGQTEVETLRQGSGQVVESGDEVLVQYTGVLWDGGEVFDSSWENGAPARFVVSDGEGSQVIPGFSKAIIGQQVGSQVGVVVAPEDGYGEQGSNAIPGDATLFFVIDILGVL